MRIRWWAWILIVAAVLAAAVAGYRQFYLIPALREPVLRQLSDPGSAQFRDELYVGPWNIQKGVLCGQVNAKNAMGGYAGFRQFSADSDGAMIFDGEPLGCGSLGKGDVVRWWWLRW